MEKWRQFLDSLATRGGNILLLWLCVGGFTGLVLHALHHPEVNVEVKTVVLATFSTFTGALVGALTGGASRQRSNDGNGGTNGKV